MRAEVAVLGGGIVGIVTATLLHDAGADVVLLEARRLVEGTTGYTTAKLTAGHGPIYSELARRFGDERARLYADANQTAIQWVARRSVDDGIDCDLERKPNYVYADTVSEADDLRAEAELERRLGLPASFVTDVPLPYEVAGAVRLDDQAQFHPRKLLLALVEHLRAGGARVFEETRAVDVGGRGPFRVVTERGAVEADHVVVATHLPFLDRGLFFARAHPTGSYAITAPIEPKHAPDGMFINVGSPTRTVRVIPDGDRLLLLVGGEGHRPGDEPHPERRFEALERWLRESFATTAAVTHRWWTHDYRTVDRLPYVGPLARSPRLLVATGFGKWGLTNGVAAAHVLADLVAGRPNPYGELFSTSRLTPRASAVGFVVENANVARRFVADRLTRAGSEAVDALGPGEGTVVRAGRRQVAVSRGQDGTLHALSAACTHLRCIVAWNDAQQTWDCPCHGSRFSIAGEVVEGPATRPLLPTRLPK